MAFAVRRPCPCLSSDAIAPAVVVSPFIATAWPSDARPLPPFDTTKSMLLPPFDIVIMALPPSEDMIIMALPPSEDIIMTLPPSDDIIMAWPPFDDIIMAWPPFDDIMPVRHCRSHSADALPLPKVSLLSSVTGTVMECDAAMERYPTGLIGRERTLVIHVAAQPPKQLAVDTVGRRWFVE
jgi:hypothetical protein